MYSALFGKHPRIVVQMDWHGGCARGVLRGIRSHPVTENWDMLLSRRLEDLEARIAVGEVDGVIGWFSGLSPDIKERLQTLPVVNVLAADEMAEIPCVGQENGEVGRLAAEFFLERGHTTFAYAGPNWSRYSQTIRETEYRRVLREHGFDCAVFDPQRNGTNLAEWLLGLPKPAAVFAHYDILGRDLAEACRQAGLRVPDDVAILGVDNDDVFCELSRPRLSSIAFPWERIGWEACVLLDRLLLGDSQVPMRVAIPPSGVIERASTDVIAGEDSKLNSALRFILSRTQAVEAVKVEDVARAAGMSRRALERRFREVLHCSPLEQIQRIRLRQAQRLLRTTSLTVKEVAERTGFNSSERFCVVFRKQLGISPGTYRRQAVLI